jgi:ABC-type uncharacterized transport system permease subunit
VKDATITIFLASAIRLTGPILVAALGELVSERAGVFNVSLEGMMLLGAFGAVIGVSQTGDVILGALCGIATGGLCGVVVGLLVVVLRADQIVTGIGFNFFALGLTIFLYKELLSGATKPVAAGPLGPQGIPGLDSLPVLGHSVFLQTPLFYLGVLMVPVLWIFLRYTRPGLMLRSVGEGAAAADAAGIPVLRVRLLAVTFTGLMAGLAGAYLAIVQAGGVFVDNMTGGRGYLAIAIAIFGRWNPPFVLAAALFFGAADALQYQGQAIGLEIPSALLLMFPFVLALLAWALLGRSKVAPLDLGRPFVRTGG